MIDPELAHHLKVIKAGRPWSKVSKELGTPAGTLSGVASGRSASLHTINSLRARFGWRDLPDPALTPYLCGTCGVVHAVGDCEGATGTPIILPRDSYVKRRRTKASAPPWLDYAVENLIELRERQKEIIRGRLYNSTEPDGGLTTGPPRGLLDI